MKWIKKIMIGVVALLATTVLGITIYLYQTRPQYEGEVSLQCVKTPVQIEFDEFGIPHIQAENKLDLMRAFGYIHAQDRMFQMELMRNVGGGTLSELIGHDGLKADILFRTIGLPQFARKKAAQLSLEKDSAYVQELHAYLEGVNEFAQSGPTPPEFKLLGIERHVYTLEDVFYIIGALSYNFSNAPKTEPVMDFIAKQYGEQYLVDLAIYHDSMETYIPNTQGHQPYAPNASILEFATWSKQVEDILPIAPLNGSNAWAIDGPKSRSQQPLFCNDTHIGYMLPQTWYEAYLSCPDFEMYGHFLAGVPFALIGRNSQLSWGVTMLLNDDMDYFQETLNPINASEIQVGNQFYPIESVEERIQVKGQPDTIIILQKSIHGPIINALHQKESWEQPISLHWTYTQKEANPVWGFWRMNQSTDLVSFQSGLKQIHSPGINVNYADAKGNIAWFATAHLKKRPSDWNPWTILNGQDERSIAWEYFDFQDNPRSVNPPQHYIYSANDWPGAIQTDSTPLWYPGYYKPQYRADRINELIKEEEQWNAEGMMNLQNDVINPMDAKVWMEMMRYCPQEIQNEISEDARNWQGQYLPHLTGPSLFNTMLYYSMRYAMQDEIGSQRFELFLTNHQMQRAYGKLLFLDASPWWDNVSTSEKESRSAILEKAWRKTIEVLKTEYGEDEEQWKWSETAHLQIQHPLGKVAILKPFLNLDEHEIFGGNETIHQSGFYLDSTAHFKVFFGSQMRIIVDFCDVRNCWNITPSGQSGHFLSPHYDDQSEDYHHQKFRPQTMSMTPFKNGKSMKILPSS
jgi:penicillin amidase